MVENQKLAVQIEEILATLVDAVPEAYNSLESGDRKTFQMIITDMKEAFLTIKNAAGTEKEPEFEKLIICCENCYASLEALSQNEETGETEQALNKLEFELLSILRIGYIQFRYFALIEGDKEKEKSFWDTEAYLLCQNNYIEESKRRECYKYDVSIVVIAYNNLEYTKLCVEAVLKNMPRKLRCELILVNHGSNDGTKEYFESVFADKQVDVKKNSIGFFTPYLISEGKYLVIISNDVIIGKDTVQIMYDCMEEDEKMAYAVPVTPNISNLQMNTKTEGISYDSLETFQAVAAKYNKRDKRLEECRVRLLNPLNIYRTEYVTNSKKTMVFAKMLLQMRSIHFGDDTISLYFRRAGYKNMLLRDIFCHHFGSVTVGNTYNYLQGRSQFYADYGVDAWERGFCYSYKLFKHLVCNKPYAENILGINAGLGSNPLKIKEELKLHTGNTTVKLTNYTVEQRFLEDLSGVSDYAEYVPDWETLHAKITEDYDYIMVCGGLEKRAEYLMDLERLYQRLKENGVMIFQTPLREQAEVIAKKYQTNEKIVEDEEYPCLQEESVRQYFVCITKAAERV